MALTDKLTAIANAIRSKTGKTETMTLDQMPTEIESISGGGLEPFVFDTGSNNNMFNKSAFLLLLKKLGEGTITEIRTKSNLENMFDSAEDIGFKIPDVIYSGGRQISFNYMFYYSQIKIEHMPKIVMSSGSVSSIYYLFYGSSLTSIPEDFFDSITCGFQTTTNKCSYVFGYCKKLRSIPKKVLSQIHNRYYSSSYGVQNSALYGCFYLCYVLDELDGIPLKYADDTMNYNMFYQTFNSCSRLKRVVFETNEGQPYVLQIKSQTINLSSYVGYTNDERYITSNSTMTTANQVTDDASYTSLKDTNDWWTLDVNYSRYNRTSAVETINSLPDTSAYLASAGGTNTIKFTGAAGAKTDGGAINTMTEEEIAVATSKGWTVTFV